MEQATLIDSFMRFYKRESPTVIRIEIPDEEALKRLMSRGRSDDKPESIRARLAWSRAAEKELEAWFKANAAYRFVEIDGMGTIDETQSKICAAIGLA
jgi:adenylate kinase family enzyme